MALATIPAVAGAWFRDARGEEPLVDLSWEGPAGCPSTAALHERIGQLLGKRGGISRKVKARATAQQTRDGWRVSILTEIDGQRGSRSLSAPVCADLAEATALILALMIDPDALVNASASATASASPAPESASSAPPSPPPSPTASLLAPAPPASRPFRPVIAAGIGLGGGVGGLLSLGWMGRSGWLEASGGSGLSRTFSLPGRPDAGARVWPSVMIEGRGCVALATPWAWLCGGGTLRRLVVEGFGVSEPGSAVRWMPGAVGGLRLASVPLASLLVAADLGAEVLLSRPRFVLENAGQAHQPPRLQVALRGQVGWVF